ncbi:MAG: hypothetical protein WBX15_04890 [Thermoanaerobaculia bacterium]
MISLIFDILFGAIGSGYLLYGWREQNTGFLLSGFVLVVYPYFLSNALLVFLVGAVVSVLPVGRHKGWF